MGLRPEYQQGRQLKSTEELIDRLVPKPLNDNQRLVIDSVRDRLMSALIVLDENVADSREKSTAVTKIEEAMMWCSKAVAV